MNGKVEWLTEAEAVEYLGTSRSSLWRWQKEGHLPVYKLGHRRRYKRADLDALFKLAEGTDEGEVEGS